MSDIINKIHNDSGSLDFKVYSKSFREFQFNLQILEDFYKIMDQRNREMDPETGYKVDNQ